MDKYLVIHPSGALTWEEVPREQLIDRFHEIIGCDCFECVRLPSLLGHPLGLVMYVDDIGKLKEPPQQHNELASRLYPGYQFGDNIVGPAIIGGLHPVPPYGELDSCPPDDRQIGFLSLYLGISISDK